MSHLQPCAACTRHVRSTDLHCPFCDAAIVATPSRPRPRAPHRMGRAAMMAFGAALTVNAAACGSNTAAPAYGGPPDPGPTPADFAEEEAEEETETPPVDEGTEPESELSEPADPEPEEPAPVPAYGAPMPPD